MKEDREIRAFQFKAEVRADDGEAPRIIGYAAVYNSLSEDLGGFREKIRPGFFTPAIGRDDVRALYNHDDNYVLGRTKNGTLTLSEDDKGLKVEIAPADTSYSRDLISLMRRGDVDQMSFQFETAVDEWDTTDPNNIIRTLVEIKKLYDTAIVVYPAYPQTSASVRKHLGELQEHKSEELKIEDGKWQERISIRQKTLSIMEKGQ